MNTNELKFTIGERLVQLREKFGLSQAQVASTIGVDRTSYAKYEKNVNKPTRKLKELSELFHVTTDYIMCLSEHPYGAPFAGQDNGNFLVFDYQIFAIRLKNLCQKNNISQEQLEKISGVSLQVIEDWEFSKRTPDAPTLSKLADFFNVSVDYLLGRTDEPGGTGFQKGLLGNINDDSPFMQKVREQMANIQVTPYEEALLNAYRAANGDIKRVVSEALQVNKNLSPEDQYQQVFKFFEHCNVNFYYARLDNNGMSDGNYVVLSLYPFPTNNGKADLSDMQGLCHTMPINMLYARLFPAMTTTGSEREKLLQDFIAENFALELAYKNGTPYISKNITMGLPKEAAEKHMQKRIAELTADQAPEDDNNQPKPGEEKRA